jgi:hypothetical protein
MPLRCQSSSIEILQTTAVRQVWHTCQMKRTTWRPSRLYPSRCWSAAGVRRPSRWMNRSGSLWVRNWIMRQRHVVSPSGVGGTERDYGQDGPLEERWWRVRAAGPCRRELMSGTHLMGSHRRRTGGSLRDGINTHPRRSGRVQPGEWSNGTACRLRIKPCLCAGGMVPHSALRTNRPAPLGARGHLGPSTVLNTW